MNIVSSAAVRPAVFCSFQAYRERRPRRHRFELRHAALTALIATLLPRFGAVDKPLSADKFKCRTFGPAHTCPRPGEVLTLTLTLSLIQS